MRRALAIAITLLAGTSQAQSGFLSEQEVVNQEQKLRTWAKAYYPGMLQQEKLPKDIIFAFLVDKHGKVTRHTAGFKRNEGVTVGDELARLLPGFSESKFKEEGGSCLRARANEPEYCVYYAVAK